MASRHDVRTTTKQSGLDGPGSAKDAPVPSSVDHPARRSTPPEVRREILGAVFSGRKATDVAREYGIHPSRISHWKKEEGERGGKEAEPKPLAQDGNAQKPAPAPRETGRYSVAFKQEVLSQVHSGRKVVEVARQYGLPETTIHRWEREVRDSGGDAPLPKSTRPESSGPSPISDEHRSLVLSLKERRPNMGVAQIQNHLKRFHALKLGRQMIGRIFQEAGIPLEERTSSEQRPEENRFERRRASVLPRCHGLL